MHRKSNNSATPPWHSLLRLRCRVADGLLPLTLPTSGPRNWARQFLFNGPPRREREGVDKGVDLSLDRPGRAWYHEATKVATTGGAA